MISPSEVRFIKLGSKGCWEKECIESSNPTIKLGFRNPYHADCLNKTWDNVSSYWSERVTPRVATAYTSQIQDFYTLDENALWVTFYKRRLYWCFAHSTVTELEQGGDRIREVKGRWNCCSLTEDELLVDRLSGKLTKTQGFRGTICSVSEKNYLISRINGEKMPEVVAAELSLQKLHDAIVPLIQHLGWKDFELFSDLIFTNGGWRRSSCVGSTQKAIDLDLSAPVSGKKAFVQIKSKANEQTLAFYYESFETMTQYDEMYFIVHSPTGDPAKWKLPDGVTVLGPKELAKLAVSGGLTEWLIQKNA